MDTGKGLFTRKLIPCGAWVTSYSQTAPILPAANTEHTSDYILVFQMKGQRVQVDGNECPLSLGKRIQDGSFPLCLAPEKYTEAIKSRVNVKWFLRDGEVWFRSLRDINVGEEILTIYTEDQSYWRSVFSSDDLMRLRQAFLAEPTNDITKAEEIIRNFQLS